MYVWITIIISNVLVIYSMSMSMSMYLQDEVGMDLNEHASYLMSRWSFVCIPVHTYCTVLVLRVYTCMYIHTTHHHCTCAVSPRPIVYANMSTQPITVSRAQSGWFFKADKKV